MLIETNTAHKFTREEVFTKKELKTIAKRQTITNYSRLGRADLTELVKKNIENARVKEEIKIVDRRDASKGVFGTITIEPLKQHDMLTFFDVSQSTIASTISDALTKKKALKLQLVLQVEMVKTNAATGENIYVNPHFRSTLTTITVSTDLELEIAFMVEKVKENMAKCMREGSGWTFGHIEKLEIHLNKFKPLKGSSYIALPKPLAQRKAIINVQNTHQECLRWAILSALHHEEVDKNCTKQVGQYKKWAGIYVWLTINSTTSPGISYDAMLKCTGVRLELLSDPDMLMMFENATRGGVAMISHRHGKANNPYMKNFDSSQSTKYLTYLDANNLYGWAMVQSLPTGDFEWVEPEEIEEILDYPDDHEYGAMVKCDLEYPEKLHDAHNDYPLAPQNVEINKVRKLVPHLVFGKTMENIRKRVDVRLVNSEKQALKLVAKPNFDRRVVFTNNLAAVHMKKTKLKFDKPVYLGACILDISKTLMYDFQYGFIRKIYGDNAHLFTDTDSLAYEHYEQLRTLHHTSKKNFHGLSVDKFVHEPCTD
ncbi:Hypothetical predicted protein [Mytilus galloprovincialis]|uniref:DNA-directed DNA polymerase n=1 Tax=Mytilus galloprovincialis TaxID=29158 RepID=A0A8B6EK36_MYTGA|nr:Hypothetical predicted protein [Mytilus galloprovincialis]